MVIVVAIVGLIVGITFPAVSSGVDSVRLSSGADTVASFINQALNRAERRQDVLAMQISVKDNTMVLHSTEAGFERRLELPDGVAIAAVYPLEPGEDTNVPRQVVLLPGGTAPRIAIELRNRRGARKIVRVDPMTGVPHIEIPSEQQP
jgi:type II secretory pathway pseudopilin PulG